MLRIKSKKGKIKSKDAFCISIRGMVSGVGFKNFILRLAERKHLYGCLKYGPYGVFIDIEGDRDVIYDFISKIYEEKPHSTAIESIKVELIDYSGYEDFKIVESEHQDREPSALTSDIAVCPDCLEDLFNPKNRRHLYPFISCSQCGPRFAGLKSVPYERNNTVMSKFDICPKCSKELQDSADRRFNDQIISCWDCGPKITLNAALSSGEYRYQSQEALDKAVELLKSGAILIVKDLSGYKVLCNLLSPGTVKAVANAPINSEPFLMIKGIKMAQEYARINDREKELLTSYRRPVLQLRLSEDSRIPDLLSAVDKYFKFQLPYSGLFYVILKNIDFPLYVKESDGIEFSFFPDLPRAVITDDRERCSVYPESKTMVFIAKDGSLSKEFMIKRSKGYLPNPLIFGNSVSRPVLALGCAKRAAFAIAKDNQFYLSPDFGDFSQESCSSNYQNMLKRYLDMLKIDYDTVSVSKDDDALNNFSKNFIGGSDKKSVKIDNLHACAVSCMAENDLKEDVIAVVLNKYFGSENDNLWSGDFIISNCNEFKRFGRFEALSGLSGAIDNYGIRLEWLNQVNDEFCRDLYSVDIEEDKAGLVVLSNPVSKDVISDIKKAVSQSRIAAKLYNTIIESCYKMVLRLRRKFKINKICLAGDMLENIFLLTNLYEKIKSKEFQVYMPGSVPANGSGIAIGQAVIAGSIIKEEKISPNLDNLY